MELPPIERKCTHPKRTYIGKKAAKDTIRRHPEQGSLNAYRCNQDPDVWHIGHKIGTEWKRLQREQRDGSMK